MPSLRPRIPAAFLSLLLACPGPAAAGELARALPAALAPLPALRPIEALQLPQSLAAQALLNVLTEQHPVQTVIPRVFEPSTLDAVVEPAPSVQASASTPQPRSVFSLTHSHPGGGGDGSHRHGLGGGSGGGDGEISALKKALAWSGAFVAVELAGGLMLDSLALRADALHLTADWAINALALGAMILARRPGAGARVKKAEPLVGLLSAGVIGFTAYEIATEALARVTETASFSAPAAIALALCGLAANGIATAVLYRHREGGLGVRGVFLHALTDAAGSLSVAVSSALIWGLGWAWADPAASALIVLLISKTALDLGWQSWKALRAPKAPR